MPISTSPEYYGYALSHIHDSGFVEVAGSAADVLIAALGEDNVRHGPVTDLGCGSGTLARKLTDQGFCVEGIDQSAAMLSLARQRAPGGRFRQESIFDAKIVPSIAVTAIGECFNYLFDQQNGAPALSRVLKRTYAALPVDGLLLFDVATPERASTSGKHFHKGDGWVVLVETTADKSRATLTRVITSFVEQNSVYQRHEETHRLRLIDPDDLGEELKALGFEVSVSTAYGTAKLPAGCMSFMAKKTCG